MSEFELIRRLTDGLGAVRPEVLLGVGDDAALIDVGTAEALCVCVDTMTAGVHFPVDAEPAAVGHKILAVNLSDLAAMGARPAWALLALTLPAPDPAWLEGFRQGFATLAAEHGVAVIGGDTTRGPLTISLTLAGWVEPDQALRRGGARAGDLIYVSGTLGDAAAGLRLWQSGRAGQEGAAELCQRLHRPQPRVALGRALRGLASAAIDVTDGLAADLGHILAASSVGATLEAAQLPLSDTLRRLCGDAEALVLALTGGDDYELCFTAPPRHEADIERIGQRLGLRLTRIGRIDAEPGLRLADPQGRRRPLPGHGYDHFRSGPA